MNLWDNALKLALMLVPTLFLLACDEELNNVGDNGNGDQFELLFEEFMLPSHVIIDSVLTNGFATGGNLLTGKYIDPEFGTVSSEAYSSLFAGDSINLGADDIEFDSLVLSLQLAPYYYGAKTIAPVTFKIHKLTEEITDLDNRTNFSTIAYDPIALGEVDFILNPEKYDTLEVGETDTLRIKLDESYFQEIIQVLKDDADTRLLPDKFHGFAILASDADKVVGITTATFGTSLDIHYHTILDGVTQDTLSHDYVLSQQGYNKITSDRSGTPISILSDSDPNIPVMPLNNKRYIQAGTGVVTEIDFKDVISFFSEKEHMIINSAEISFGNIESTSEFSEPSGLSLYNTNDNSEIASLEILGSDFATIQSDLGTQLVMPYESNDNNSGRYFGLSSRYFQLLYDNSVERSTAIIRGADFSGNTVISTAGYTVDRFVIHQDSIKLKVFYTLPK